MSQQNTKIYSIKLHNGRESNHIKLKNEQNTKEYNERKNSKRIIIHLIKWVY